MKGFLGILLIALVGVMFSGCKTTLNRAPYDPVEKYWIDYLQDAYPNWRPPLTPPPLTLAGDAPQAPQEAVIAEAPTEENIDVVAITPPDVVMEEVQPEREVHQAKTQETVYTVEKGDTLWDIAKEFYGSGAKWKLIEAANKDALKNKDKLTPGTKIVIPPK